MKKAVPLHKKIEAALDNKSLQTALKNLADAYPEARENAYRGIDFQLLQEEIAAIKKDSGERVHELAQEFESKLTSRGAFFHRAENGGDVVNIIKRISLEHKAQKIVKSKSMASEEIHLNEHLEETAQIVETDLGEWIIQQIGEKPSHIVMPAIHLTREKCSEIFSHVTKRKVSTHIPTMVSLARDILRAHFLDADIGITGCNAAIAETGTMVIFTNEGNARLTTSLPPVHIVLLGYEKLIPRLSDLAPLAKALPKSATGQLITSYITMISAPSETLADKTGPGLVAKELHVILMDNGRLKMLKDPDFKEVGQCLRCASCLNVCPAYEMLGGQVYGHIYSGGIGTLLTAFLNSAQQSESIEALCLQCGSCKAKCPAKIPIPDLILKMRSQLKNQFPPPFPHRLALGKILPSPGLLSLSLKAAKAGTALLARRDEQGKPFIKNLPGRFKKIVKNRFLPGPASRPLHMILKNYNQELQEPAKGNIAFFAGCLADYVYPEIGTAMVRLLNQEGYRVIFPEQGCCGAPALYSGLAEAAEKSAKVNLESLNSLDYDFLVTPCPTCTNVLRNLWPEWLKDSPGYRSALVKITTRVIDFIQLYHRLKKKTYPQPRINQGIAKTKIAYHQSCHLKRSCGITDEPRHVLESREELEWVDLAESDRCCGFAGSYSFKFPDLSNELLARKLDNISKSGASLVAVDCPGCLLSLQGGLAAKQSPVRAMHSAEILDQFKN